MLDRGLDNDHKTDDHKIDTVGAMMEDWGLGSPEEALNPTGLGGFKRLWGAGDL